MNKEEFALNWVDAVAHPVGAIGLWGSIVKAIEAAQSKGEEFIIICEDDHVFTEFYRKDYLFANLISAIEQNVELLAGGIGGFGYAVPVGYNRFWMDWFYCTQFIVVFRSLYNRIIEYDFAETDTADGVLSVLSREKQVLYPFISVQKDFGYSDVTRFNDTYRGLIEHLFRQTAKRLDQIHEVYVTYNRL